MSDQHHSILRDKVNEMYDNLGNLNEIKFRVQILNALYVIADQLDRLEAHRTPVTPDGPEQVRIRPRRIQAAERAPVAHSEPCSDVLCPTCGDVRDHGAVT